jgi:ABC-type branched-subunit amino acid transport system substrate-binding protein
VRRRLRPTSSPLRVYCLDHLVRFCVLAVGRTYPSDAITTQVLPRVISAYGWTNIAVLHVNDDYANNYARGMRDNSPPSGVNVMLSISYTTNDATTYGPACTSLEASSVNIIVIVAWDHDMSQILTECRTAGPNNVDLLAAGYVWISADAASAAGSHAAGVASGLTAAQSAQLLDGLLNFYATPQGTSGFGRFQADWATHGREDCIK